MASLGVSEKIIAVSEEVNYPSQLKNKEKIGLFGQINLERVISLNPSLVITSGLEQNSLTYSLRQTGINVKSIYPKSVADFYLAVDTLGTILNAKEKADSLKNYIKAELAKIPPSASKPKVFVEIYGNPLMTAADSSFVGELITLSGAENIFPILARDYCRVNPEKVVERNPDFIILTYPATADEVRKRLGWQNIKAVKNNNIVTIKDLNPDLILRASPRFVEGVKQLHALWTK